MDTDCELLLSDLAVVEPDHDIEVENLSDGIKKDDIDLSGTRKKECTCYCIGASSNCFLVQQFIAKVKQSWFVIELRALMKLALPIILMYFFQQLLFFVVVIFVGHSSKKPTELDAAAVNVTGLSAIIGLSSAADTLCPQSYGFKNFKRVGIIMQRGILILCLTCLPIAAIWLNSESILLLLGQKPCIVSLTKQYMQLFILALPALVVYTMLQKYLQAQCIAWIFVITGIIQVTSAVVLNVLFIIVAKMGVVGASIGLVMSYSISTLFLFGYIWVRGLHKQTWGGWSWESLNEWGPFLKLAIPGFLMICFESWTFEISVIVTGSIDETQLAVNAILIQLTATAFVIPLGIGSAVSVRVGNELGAGNPQKAKRAAYTAVIVEVLIAIILVALLLAIKNYIGKAFTSDISVTDDTAVALCGALGVFFSGQIQGTIAGVLRGSGRQLLGAVLNFVLYYIIGLPLGICLALLTDMGTLGMWIGLSVADFLQASTYILLLVMTNWKALSKKAMVNANGQPKRSNAQLRKERGIVNDNDEAAQNLVTIPKQDQDEMENEQTGEGISTKQISSTQMEDTIDSAMESSSVKNNVKRTRQILLLTKGSVFVVGFVVLVIGVILATVVVMQHSNATDCTIARNSTCSGYCSSDSMIHTLIPEPTKRLKHSVASVEYLY